jgi:hypothetical protein
MGLRDGHGLDAVWKVHAVAPGVPLIVSTAFTTKLLPSKRRRNLLRFSTRSPAASTHSIVLPQLFRNGSH